VAVSPGYADEILTPEFGSGLHEFLHTRRDSISGILNGIQPANWDPETDQEIPARFSVASLPLRAGNKSALQREVGLADEPHTMLFGLISRLVHQKGVDLALSALQRIGDQNWQAIILGTGEPEIEVEARRLQEAYPDRVRSAILFDPAFSRRIYAGADVMLIPSRYEPCGLTQMIAMRYGCVPVARATGGLRDTIQDYSQTKTGTGFLFQDPTPEAMVEALQRTLQVYQDKRRWQGLQRRGMRRDFSWERSAQDYLQTYVSLLNRRAVESGT
jgi:starch synthase